MADKDTATRQDFSIVVIGASAGGIKALSALVRGLPPTLEAAVFVVQHLESTAEKSRLPDILRRYTLLAVHPARDGMAIRPGCLYVARPGMHLRIRPGSIGLDKGEPVRFVRPAADVLFISAAEHYGPRVIGVVLTGNGSDGAAGCLAVKAGGGVCMAQDPKTAPFPDMPGAAMATGAVDHILPVNDMAGQIICLVDRRTRRDTTGKAL
ncbi:MAG: chemotaxis protein CheB [Desulfobacter sp.]